MLASRRSALPRRFKFSTPEAEFCPIRNGMVTPENYVVAFNDELDLFSAGAASETYNEFDFVSSSDTERKFLVSNDATKIELFLSTPGGLDAPTSNTCSETPCTSGADADCVPLQTPGGEALCGGCKKGGKGVNMYYEFDLTSFCGNGTLQLFLEYNPGFDTSPGIPTNDTTLTGVRPRLVYAPEGGSEGIRWRSFTSGQGNASPDKCSCAFTTTCACTLASVGLPGDNGEEAVLETLPNGIGSVDGIGTITYTKQRIDDTTQFVNLIETDTNVEVVNGVAFGTRVDPTGGTNLNCSALDPVTVAIARFS